MPKKKILILENDKEIDESILSYIDKHDYEADAITKLQFCNIKDITDQINNAKRIIFKSTFANREQIRALTQIADKRKGKEFYISSTDLYIKLNETFDSKYAKKLAKRHTFYSIETDTKIDNKRSGNFIKRFKYFFDTVKYYWNEDYQCILPERPKCIYEDNLKDIYLQKPMWIPSCNEEWEYEHR